MSGIRALQRADLPAVGTLFAQVTESPTPAARITSYFEALFLDDPWADPEIPALVYESPDGEIVGFIGSSTRRLRLDGRPIRMAVSSNLVAHPDWRARGVGALLNRQYLAGPQDLTLADRANDDSRKLWLALGGQELVHASVGWYRILRPGATAGALMDLRGRRGGALRGGARLAAGPVDALARRLPRIGSALPPEEPAGSTEPLTPDMLLEQMSSIGRRLRLYPDYDAEWLRWLFGQLADLHAQGRVVARLVRGAKGQVLGWFVTLSPEHGMVQALQIAAPTGDADAVLDHLFWQAWCDGAAAVHGRLDPTVSTLLSRPGVVVRKSARALVHAEESTALAVLGSPKALLSHLDGEWVVTHARRL